MENLTDKQAAMLQVIKEHIASKGFPPTIRQLQEHFNLASVNAVQQTLQALEKKGFVKRTEKGSARGLEVVGWHPYHLERGYMLPLLGRIAAGTPLIAYEEGEDQILLDPELVGENSDFALRVTGNSMIDAGINDGDVLIIQKAEKCANGEIVIAFWNEAATVKRFYLEPGHYRLQPENPELNPIMIKKDDPTFRIIGRVKALIRKF
jgi:repressor LexA